MPTSDELRQKQEHLRALLRKARKLSAAGVSSREKYAAHREMMGARSRSASLAARDIGEIPPSAEPELVEACRFNFRLFCESFLADWFYDPWSDDHLAQIKTIEDCVLHGGKFALATPRGFGKTNLALAAALWCVLYGHQWYVLLIGANLPKAREMFEAIKLTLETTSRLTAGFPAVCYPIARLEGISQRRLLYHEQKVIIRFTQSKIILPNIPGSPAASAVIQFAGITSGIRGLRYVRPDAQIARPSLVIIDDPQTDQTAVSLRECQKREKIIQRTIKNLGGGRKALAVLMAITVLCRDDLSARYLDRTKHPEYRGSTTKMLYAFPSDMEPWKRYDLVRREHLMSGGDGSASTEFYRENRAAMDAGAKVAWPARFKDGEISALQHAMNLFFEDRAAFMAEQQNDPEPETEATSKLTPELLAGKLNKLARSRVPKACQYLSAFIDVHARLLYWMVCAWTQEFGGGPIDYGTYPRQPLDYFAQESAPIAMEQLHPGMGEDAWLLASLQLTVDALLARDFTREDGAALKIGKLLLDAHWGQHTELVKSFCRRHKQYQSIVMPSMGHFIGASGKPFSQYHPEPGAQVGFHWRSPPAKGGDRHILIDTNWFKSFSAARLAMPLGTPGGWEIFGEDPREHRLLFDHCCAEEPKAVKELEKGLLVEEWKWKPGRPDNHYWDDLIGCAVGGSILGAAVPGMVAPPRRAAAVPLSQMWGRK